MNARRLPPIAVTGRRVPSHGQHPPCYRAIARDGSRNIIEMIECADRRRLRNVARELGYRVI